MALAPPLRQQTYGTAPRPQTRLASGAQEYGAAEIPSDLVTILADFMTTRYHSPMPGNNRGMSFIFISGSATHGRHDPFRRRRATQRPL
jgi:hypothetical protein